MTCVLKAFSWLACCLLISGCANRVGGVLVPVGSTVAGATQVDVLVATTREASPDTGILFSGERGRKLTLTEISVSIPPDQNRQAGQVQWPRRLPADPSREFSTVRVTSILGEKKANTWLKAHLPRNRRVMIFVHGYNSKYEDAVYRFAQIVHDSGADVAPVIFTWPS